MARPVIAIARGLSAAALLALFGCGVTYPEPQVGDARELSSTSGFESIHRDIFTPSCARTNCHGHPRAAPFSFEGSGVYDALVGQPSRQQPALNLVEPGAPGTSYLLLKLRGEGGTVGGRATRMPLNRSPLSDEQVARIEAWILDGAIGPDPP